MTTGRQQSAGSWPASARIALAEIERGTAVRMGAIVAFLAATLFLLPAILNVYWVNVMTAVAVYAVVALGAGLLFGRVGIISLFQIALLAVGAWICARLLYATSIPFPIVLIIGGVITAIIGVLIGLPALRLSGLHLALITLMGAGAISILLGVTLFPNGGGGFLGVGSTTETIRNIRRPGIAHSDSAYYRYTVIVAALMFLLVLWQIASKPGRAWAAIRESQSAALAAGVNITYYKLWAFALASFMTGVAGGLVGASAGRVDVNQFRTYDSITLLAVILMGGIYSLWGAVVAGLLFQLLPALLENWGVSPNLSLILFGVGVVQVVTTAPDGIVAQLPRDLAKLGRLLLRGGRLVAARRA